MPEVRLEPTGGCPHRILSPNDLIAASCRPVSANPGKASKIAIYWGLLVHRVSSRVVTIAANIEHPNIIPDQRRPVICGFSRPVYPLLNVHGSCRGPSAPRQRAQVEVFGSSTRQVCATAEEFRAIPEAFAQVRNTGSLGDKPLAVVSADEQSPDWLELQDELAALSSNNSHRRVEGATHVSLLYDGCDAQVTSTAILAVLEAVHNDRPLTP